MNKFLKLEEYIYKDVSVRMSKKSLYNLMYAGIITKSYFPNNHCLCYEYDRKQNAYNIADVKVHIHPSQMENFEKESGLKLRDPVTITINC